MSQKINITCDGCQGEIKPNEHTSREYLVLSSGKYAPISYIVFCIEQQPILDEDKHFCGVGCLIKWTGNNQTTPYYPPPGSITLTTNVDNEVDEAKCKEKKQTKPYTEQSLDAHIKAVGESKERFDNPMGITGEYKEEEDKWKENSPEDDPGYHSPGSAF